jgi:D-alanyl-D-alanine-carboxypeptidase/D-alanyl-D-alanine-endopeptidase
MAWGSPFTVAGSMAEVVTGKAWNAIFTDELATPLGLPADIHYYVDPDSLKPTLNPLLAGGLVMSMNEYAKIAQLVFNKGSWDGNQLVSSQLFDQQAIDPYPNAEITGAGPDNAVFHYGLAAWLECDTPATGCAIISSPGVFGFTPWIDRATGYYAIIGMENRNLLQSNVAEQLQQRLKPLIIEALGKL